MTKLVSIVVPAYNVEKFIAETIDSVIAQTYENWELIVVDDGAKDATASIVSKYVKKDTRISLISIENGGVSNARNTGIRLCKGEFIAFLDADDLWKKENLFQKVDLLENQPEIDWVFSDMAEINEDSIETGLAPLGTDDNILDNILLWEGEVVPGPCSNIVMRKSCGEKVLFDTNLSTAADQDYCLQLIANGFQGARIPKPLWQYRILSYSMSRNISVMEKDHICVYRKAARNGLFKSNEFRKKCFSNLYLILAANWWGDGKNKVKGFSFLIKSIWMYPQNATKVVNKLFK